jgi:hypothetical protein
MNQHTHPPRFQHGLPLVTKGCPVCDRWLAAFGPAPIPKTQEERIAFRKAWDDSTRRDA